MRLVQAKRGRIALALACTGLHARSHHLIHPDTGTWNSLNIKDLSSQNDSNVLVYVGFNSMFSKLWKCTYICCMLGSESMVVAMFIRAGLLRKAPKSIPVKRIGMRIVKEITLLYFTSGSSHARHSWEHPWHSWSSRRHPGADLVLGDLEVRLVTLVVRLEL